MKEEGIRMDFPIEAFREVVDELCHARRYGSLPEFVFGDCKTISCWEQEVEEDSDYTIVCANGISKMVFLSDSFGEWVLKIPRRIDAHKNFCQVEADNYAEAEKRGLKDFFAPTFFVEEYLGIPLYAQIRLECDSTIAEEDFYSYAQDMCDPEDFEDKEDYDDAIYDMADNLDPYQQIEAVFGDDSIISDLCDFCEEREINDLHSANFGVLNGSMRICDFSGF